MSRWHRGCGTRSQSGDNYWAFDDTTICKVRESWAVARIYCFENPYVDVNSKSLNTWEESTSVGWRLGGWVENNIVTQDALTFDQFVGDLLGQAQQKPQTCYICGCFREEGCFAPGVKITMADGSLRNIEDVRAGDMVRNARTGAPVKVGKVIEGPEALPLIRFGFEGTTVTTSQAHPVLTAAGLKPANELKKGDAVFDARGNPHPLTILETLPVEEGQRVINLDLDAASSDADERLMVSDGIVTGDIVLQGLLKERK